MFETCILPIKFMVFILSRGDSVLCYAFHLHGQDTWACSSSCLWWYRWLQWLGKSRHPRAGGPTIRGRLKAQRCSKMLKESCILWRCVKSKAMHFSLVHIKVGDPIHPVSQKIWRSNHWSVSVQATKRLAVLPFQRTGEAWEMHGKNASGSLKHTSKLTRGILQNHPRESRNQRGWWAPNFPPFGVRQLLGSTQKMFVTMAWYKQNEQRLRIRMFMLDWAVLWVSNVLLTPSICPNNFFLEKAKKRTKQLLCFSELNVHLG